MKQIKESLKRYTDCKIKPGSFLTAVLQNNLFGAIGSADIQNQDRLKEICQYIYMELPSNCWGSKEIFNNFLNSK